MTLVLNLPDSWNHLLGLDEGDAEVRAREMLVIERYRQGMLSRGQVAEMLGLGFHEVEKLLNEHGAEQQPTWEELEMDVAKLRELLKE